MNVDSKSALKLYVKSLDSHLLWTQCIHCRNIGIRRKRMVKTTKVYSLLFAKELSVSLGSEVFKTTLYLAVSVSSSHLTLADCLWSQVAIPDKLFIFSLSSVIVNNQYCTRHVWNKFCSCPGNQREGFIGCKFKSCRNRVMIHVQAEHSHLTNLLMMAEYCRFKMF